MVNNKQIKDLKAFNKFTSLIIVSILLNKVAKLYQKVKQTNILTKITLNFQLLKFHLKYLTKLLINR